METKKEIRKEIRRKRREMNENFWIESGKAISAAVVSHPWFLKEKNIYTYVDYNGEAGTREIIDTAFKKDKNVWVPKVMGEVMHFYRIESMEELKAGAHGIMEPVGNKREAGEISDRDPDGDCGLMIMLGVAFDEKCRRLGYGGGYYDRYLAAHPGFRTMALAFEFQVFQEVPCEEHDICPEILVTERRILCRLDCQKTRRFC